MIDEQKKAITNAYCDLVGIYQTIVRDGNGQARGHDWAAHKKTVRELEAAFPFIEPAPLDLNDEWIGDDSGNQGHVLSAQRR